MNFCCANGKKLQIEFDSLKSFKFFCINCRLSAPLFEKIKLNFSSKICAAFKSFRIAGIKKTENEINIAESTLS